MMAIVATLNEAKTMALPGTRWNFLRLCTELRSVDNNTGGACNGRLMMEERGEEAALKLEV
jgi:hypothetical protein